MSDTQEPESTAEREGIVDQQDAVLERLEREGKQEPDTDVDPMEGEAPTG
jgi:hypothetical protein